jgi:enoyl-CoA hydratase/carnithine racemase
MANAGGSKGKQRKRYLIGDRQYWADESELPGLILAVAAKPEKQPATVAKTRAKASKRAPEALKVAAEVLRPAPGTTLLERLNALQAQFQAAENEILLRSLAIVAQRLAELEDDDEMVLLLT